MLKDYQDKIINLLIRQEQLLSGMYKNFSERFPEHSQFFDKISSDEMTHAAWLQKALHLIDDGKVTFDEGRVKTWTVKSFLEHIEKTIDTLSDAPLVKCLVHSLDLEKSLLESKTFTHFQGLDPSLDRIFAGLIRETALHAKEIQAMLDKNRPKK